MIKERMDTKIKLWMKHQIRKASWDSLKSTMKVDEAKRWVHSLSLDIYKSVWKDEPYMPPKDLTEDLKRTSRDVYDKVRGWLELYRPGGEKELEVIKAKTPPKFLALPSEFLIVWSNAGICKNVPHDLGPFH